MKLALFTALVVSVVHAHQHNIAPEAIARFDAANSAGAVGWARVAGGMVNISLDLTNFNFSATQVNRSQCRAGITYHIHSTIAGQMVGDACGAAGGHYDPWFACGGATAEVAACANKNMGGCINRTYACSTATFMSNPLYGCEVGDWSGKYGKLMPVNASTDVYWISSKAAMPMPSPFEIGSKQLYATGAVKSIVFHCGSPRILCSPFGMDTMKNSSETAHGVGLAAATTAGSRLVADFGEMSGPLVEFGGQDIRISGLFSMMSSCAAGTTTTMSISNAMWTGTTTSSNMCTNFLPIYDPTVQCPANSASPWCTNGKRCNTITPVTPVAGTYYVSQGTVLVSPFPTAAMTWETRLMDQSSSTLLNRAVVIQCGTSQWCAKIVAGPSTYTTKVPTGASGMIGVSKLVVGFVLLRFVW